MKEKMKRNRILIIIMFFIGLTGIIMLSYNYVLSKVRLTFETVNLEFYGNHEPQNIEDETQISTNDNEEIENTVENPKESTNQNYYFGYLEIPIINLKQGLVPINSKENNVNKNIQTIYPSDYPNIENGNLILAAHSGTSKISYFKNLYKLNNNDDVYIIYNNERYIYKIVNIYTVPKNGEVAIYRNQGKTTLTLITCTKNDDTTQTVYICELIRKEGI